MWPRAWTRLSSAFEVGYSPAFAPGSAFLGDFLPEIDAIAVTIRSKVQTTSLLLEQFIVPLPSRTPTCHLGCSCGNAVYSITRMDSGSNRSAPLKSRITRNFEMALFLILNASPLLVDGLASHAGPSVARSLSGLKRSSGNVIGPGPGVRDKGVECTHHTGHG